MSEGARKRWVWDLYPLAKQTWGNQEISDDGTPPGQTIEVRRSYPRGRITYLNTGESHPLGTMTLKRQAYIPTDDDIALVRRCYPKDDPQRPSWHNIKRDLVLAEHDGDKLDRTEAPVLLGLLKKTMCPGAAPRNRKKTTAAGGTAQPVRATSAQESEEKALNGNERRSLSPDDQAKVLARCLRRCCICFVLDSDASEKKGQLAHLDHNRSNNATDNFVYLCLPHHDTYDTKTSQAKNLTEHEVRSYQTKLHQAVEQGEVPPRQGPAALKFPAQQPGPVNINGAGNVVAGGNVNYVVNMPRAKRGKGRPATRPPIIPGTVSDDPRMVGYLNYLVRRYEKFKKWECDLNGQRMGYGVIRNAYKEKLKYELIHTPKTLFEAGARYLQQRIENTQLGKRRKGHKLYSSFDEFDEHTSHSEGLPV